MDDNSEVIVKRNIDCSFCGKGRNLVEQMVEGPLFNGSTLYICNECVDDTYKILHKGSEVKVKKKREKIPNPEKIKAFLDEYIISQDDAKIAVSVAVYNHYKRINLADKNTEIEKSNLLMIGSSGSGKTLTVKTIAKMFNLPCVIADATTITESGYVGDDAGSLIKRLLQAADNDIERAQQGIIFIDEIDKKARKSESSSTNRDISGEGVQQALLKIIEGTIIRIEDDFADDVEFDTSNVLFICSGSFTGLDEIIRKNRSQTSIGIGAVLNTHSAFSNIVKTATSEDFIKYGLIPEFVGRCPIIVVFDDLTLEMMGRILKEPKNNLVDQFKSLFKYEGVILEFDDKYLLNIAEECLKQKVGARGLRSIMERDLQSTQFILPRIAKEGVGKIFVDGNRSIKYVYRTKKRATNGK